MDYFAQTTGDLTMIVIFDHFDGTLSNPLTGKSVPGTGQGRFTIYFAPDGSVTEVLSQGSSRNPLSPVHGLTVCDADENIVKDVGRDYLSYNKHPFSITPLCEGTQLGARLVGADRAGLGMWKTVLAVVTLIAQTAIRAGRTKGL